MTHVDAVFRGGVFEPLEPVKLPDEQRVRLSIESCAKQTPPEWLAKLMQRHEEFIKAHGPLPDSAPDIAADRLR